MGIQILHPPENDDNISLTLDVIALHGLNGHHARTWTSTETQTLWLRDFLPSDLPTARIMTFGYDATAAFANSRAGIVEHARDLLGCLGEEREGAKRRPLVFIGHSLGGLVIKQALIIASLEPLYAHIYNSTKGIVFFGTPHQGSNLATFAATLIRIPTMLLIKPSPELLGTLRKGCEKLGDLSERFRTHHEARPYAIVSFYETRCLKGMNGLVVEKESALLTPPGEIPTFEEQIPVNSNHREMCRFASNKDSTYKAAVRSLKRLRKGDVPEFENEHYLVPHIVSQYFTGRNDIREQMRESLVEDLYSEKLAHQMFVLYGLGGSGKTQISLKFAQEHRERFRFIFWIDASSKETAEGSFAKIAKVCKLENGIEAVKSWLAGRDYWLLIIDNADDPNLDISQFFPEGTKGTIVITTRNPDLKRLGTAGNCHIDGMAPPDAVGLLLKTSAIEARSDENTRKTAEEVVKTLEYFALAIIQAGAVIRQGLCSLDGFCELYSNHRKELIESGRPQPGMEYQYSVYTTWDISIHQIEKMSDKHAVLALELLRLFAFMHFDGIREEIFRQARLNSDLDSGFGETRLYGQSIFGKLMPEGWNGLLMARALVLLVGFSLISMDSSRNISIHPLVHEWSRDRLPEEEQLKCWKSVVAVMGMSTNFSDDFTDHRHRRVLLSHINSCLANREGQAFSDDPDRLEILWSVRKFVVAMKEAHQWEKVLRLSQKDLKMQEASLLDGQQLVLTLENIGEALSNLGRYEDSSEIYEKALQKTQNMEDPFLTLTAINGLALNHNSLKEHQKAIDICTKGLKRVESSIDKDHSVCLCAMETIASAHNSLGSPKEAVKFTEKVFEARKRRDGEQHVSTIIAGESLADDYTDLKMFKRARELQEQTVVLLEKTVGADHALTVVAVSKLADFPRRESRNPLLRRKGIKSRQEALKRCQEVLGETDPRTLTCLEHLSEDYFICGSL